MWGRARSAERATPSVLLALRAVDCAKTGVGCMAADDVGAVAYARKNVSCKNRDGADRRGGKGECRPGGSFSSGDPCFGLHFSSAAWRGVESAISGNVHVSILKDLKLHVVHQLSSSNQNQNRKL